MGVNVMRLFAALPVAAATALAVAAVGLAGSAGAGTRQHFAVQFTLPDVCTFPITVHTEGWMTVTPQVTVLDSTATLSTEDSSQTLTQQNHSVSYPTGAQGDYVDVYLEKIVIPGQGLVYGTMGHMTFFYDGQGNFVGSEFMGHWDPYSTYTAAVCGYLSG
jgi:hypothetical protein